MALIYVMERVCMSDHHIGGTEAEFRGIGPYYDGPKYVVVEAVGEDKKSNKILRFDNLDNLIKALASLSGKNEIIPNRHPCFPEIDYSEEDVEQYNGIGCKDIDKLKAKGIELSSK